MGAIARVEGPISIAAIEIERVTRTYGGGVRALDAISLTVEQGERCCLLGPNGAGKTTIMKLLQGALRPDSGDVRVLGSGAGSGAFIDAKRRIGIVPQNPGLYADLTVEEYLDLVRALYRRGRPVEMAEVFGLAPYLRRPCASLSGGLQRRLLVAAAVLCEPELLLLDEPTVGLDPLAAAETRSLLREAMTGRTVLMATHNLTEAEELCDTVAILRAGHVLVHDQIDTLRRQVVPRVRLVARQPPQVLGAQLDALHLASSSDGDGVWLSMADARSHLPDLLRALLDGGIDIYECRVTQPSLEDLFVDVVTRE